MRWLKYFLICVITLVVFAGGAAFMYVVQESDNLFHFKPKTQYNFEISATRHIPYEIYEGIVRFEIQQDLSKQERQAAESVLKNIIERAGKTGFCIDDNLGILTTTTSDPNFRPPRQDTNALTTTSQEPIVAITDVKIEETSINGSLRCTITKNDLDTYNAMLKDIDYLALKSGAIALRVYKLQPTINLSEMDKQQQSLYEDIFKKAQDTAQHYAKTLQGRCALTRVLTTSPRWFDTMREDVDIDTSFGNVFSVRSKALPSATTQVTLPFEKEATARITADMAIICK